MTILENINFFIALTIIFISLSIYLFFKLKIKKSKGKSLNKTNEAIGEKIIENKKILMNIENEVENKNQDLQYLIELEKNKNLINKELEENTTLLHGIENTISKLDEKESEYSDHLTSLKNDISIFQPVEDLMNYGFFDEPEYLFDTSDRYKEEIKSIREQQKTMIKNNSAITIPESIAITSNTQYVKKILTGQTKLMIKAFNIECDKLISLLKPSNFAKILEKIDKVAEDIEKSALTLQCGFNVTYIDLKFKECELQYQFKLKDQREKEEQAIIKEQIREEQQATREFERAINKAQKSEELFKRALEAAKLELSVAMDKDKTKLSDKIAFLEQQLSEAEKNEQRAMSMAEQTKRGHVYVISNIGSFGENIYKIGLTRRLEPLDRVKELGSASVPFSFDVHAMIYSDDAPALESTLHREFKYFRVNQVNQRKEFFNVSLLDIKEKVKEITGNEQDFKLTAIAEDYYESQKLKANFA